MTEDEQADFDAATAKGLMEDMALTQAGVPLAEPVPGYTPPRVQQPEPQRNRELIAEARQMLAVPRHYGPRTVSIVRRLVAALIAAEERE